MSKKFRKNNVYQTVFEKNYKQISDSQKEILNQKYICSFCSYTIEHDNPFLCFESQKLFHQPCVNRISRDLKIGKEKLFCPICQDELPIEKFKILTNYEEIRAIDAQILNQMGKKFNSDEYIDKSRKLYINILNKLSTLHLMIEQQKNYKINNLIEEFRYNIINPSIEEISTAIIDELDLLEEYIINAKKGIQKQEIKHKNEIHLKYLSKEEGKQKIFGEGFVENNINNISLVINGKKSNLVGEYNLKKGENDIIICIKNTLTNLSEMFDHCEILYNIDELKYLNTENVFDFYCMFNYSNISNIKALENWDTSKSESFGYMFSNCKSLTNIEPLKNWNVSRSEDFSNMFYQSSINNLKSLENWNVSGGKIFDYIFSWTPLTDIKGLENWDMSNALSLKYFFFYCKNLEDISSLKNWNVSKCVRLEGIFSSCSKLSDITPIKNWNISNCQSLESVFSGCENLSDISPFKNWNVSGVKNFGFLFDYCLKLSDISPIKNWNMIKCLNLKCLFNECLNLSDISPLKIGIYQNAKTWIAHLIGVVNYQTYHLLKIGMYQT